MDDVLSLNDLRDDEKAKRYFQLQTPELTQVAISQKPDKESLTPPPPLNPAFLNPPPTVENPSEQGPKSKRRRIQFVNYLDDHKAHAKQLRKRRHKKFKPYQYSMGEEDEG